MMVTQTTMKPVLSLSEAAKYLGIGTTTLRRYIKANAIPYRRVARRVLISREALDKWLEGSFTSNQK